MSTNCIKIMSQEDVNQLIQEYKGCKKEEIHQIVSSEKFKDLCDLLQKSGSTKHTNLADMIKAAKLSDYKEAIKNLEKDLQPHTLECEQLVFTNITKTENHTTLYQRQDIPTEYRVEFYKKVDEVHEIKSKINNTLRNKDASQR